jgi:hypothetical protein
MKSSKYLFYIQVKPTLICITYAQYRDEGKGGHVLDKLEPGNYTFKLRATSLAGNGSWTDPVYFNIEAKEGKFVYIVLYLLTV